MAGTTPPRVERSDLLALPVFWAIHYYLLAGTDEDDSADLMQPFFGLSNQFVNDYYVEHFDKTPWPYFRIPLPGGFAVEVEYAIDLNSETRFVIDNDDWDSSVVLGYCSGHAALPALQWSEVADVGRCIFATAGNPVHRRSGLLLLLPGGCITERDDEEAVRCTLCEAWDELKLVPSGGICELVDNVIASCSADTRWWRDAELGWINDSPHSLRNPDTKMCEFAPRKYERIQEFFAMVAAHS